MFEREMSFRTLPTILLQIFCKIIFISKVIIRIIEEADDIFEEFLSINALNFCFTVHATGADLSKTNLKNQTLLSIIN